MNLENIEQSIVIVADRHNPSILHPSFLEKEKIIEEGLHLAEPPLTTPDISIAAFVNGLRITVDNARLQITNNRSFENKLDLAKVASSYLNVLPHVDYKSVGSNVFIFIENSDAQNYLIENFIKSGPWNSESNKMDSAGLRFVYSQDGAVINLSYDAGNMISANGQERNGILIRGNYHKEIQSVNDALSAINNFSKNIDYLISIIDSTFK